MTQIPDFEALEQLVPNVRLAGELMAEIEKTVADVVAMRLVDSRFTLPNPVTTAREIIPQVEKIVPVSGEVTTFYLVEEVYLFVLEAIGEAMRIRLKEDESHE